MASFRSVPDAIQAAFLMQREFSEAEAAGEIPVGVRIGIAAGEASPIMMSCSAPPFSCRTAIVQGRRAHDLGG